MVIILYVTLHSLVAINAIWPLLPRCTMIAAEIKKE